MDNMPIQAALSNGGSLIVLFLGNLALTNLPNFAKRNKLNLKYRIRCNHLRTQDFVIFLTKGCSFIFKQILRKIAGTVAGTYSRV
jgi:hypothetical protein